MDLPNLLVRLRSGSVAEKCSAADEIAKLGARARDAVPALLEALDDPGEAVLRFRDGYGPDTLQHQYVRESAVRALFAVSPSHLPAARRVMEELRGKPSVLLEGIAVPTDQYVEFPTEMWAASEPGTT
jgi:HEAT repeat protein